MNNLLKLSIFIVLSASNSMASNIFLPDYPIPDYPPPEFPSDDRYVAHLQDLNTFENFMPDYDSVLKRHIVELGKYIPWYFIRYQSNTYGEVGVSVCFAESAAEAMVLTRREATRSAAIKAWGAYFPPETGAPIFGDVTYSSRKGGTIAPEVAIDFSYGNACYHVSFDPPSNSFASKTVGMDDAAYVVSNFAHILIDNAKNNLEPAITDVEEEKRNTQISAAVFEGLLADITESEQYAAFAETRTTDSKWVHDLEDYSLGRRREFIGENGEYIRVDICELPDENAAQTVLGHYRDRIINPSYIMTPVVTPDSLESVDLDAWGYWFHDDTYTVISRIGRYVYQVYAYAPGQTQDEFKTVCGDVTDSILSFTPPPR